MSEGISHLNVRCLLSIYLFKKNSCLFFKKEVYIKWKPLDPVLKHVFLLNCYENIEFLMFLIGFHPQKKKQYGDRHNVRIILEILENKI